MSTDKTQPNFFILLGLNPDEGFDQAKFEQVLREKRLEWSRQSSGIAKKALAAQKNLELLPEIRRIMEDTAQREVQAQEARAELASGKQTVLERFEKDMAYINAKEYVEQSELDALIKEYKQVLSEQEIRKRVTVKISAPTQQTTQLTQQLEPSVFKDITDKLQSLHLKDLYELLGMPPTTANPELCQAAQALYNDMSHRQPKSADVTAKTDLAGHAKDIFSDQQKRKRYNESIRQSSLNALLKDLDERISRTVEKEVHENQIMLFLGETRKAGWRDEEALARLKEYARQRKWFLRIPTIDVSTLPQRCSNCNELNDKNHNYCSHCKYELAINCPNCGKRALSDEIGCGSCGFPVGNRYLVDDLLNREPAIRDLKQKQELLQEAERIWKPSKPDKRALKIQELKTTIQQQLQAQQRDIKQLQQLLSQRQFYTARQFLATHTDAIAQQERAEHQRSIETEMNQAQECIRKAQSRTISQEERFELCRQALRICTDYKEARDLLSTMPPAPPRNLQARGGGGLVSLKWEPSPTKGVQYKIVRRSHTQPVSVKDGVLLETVAGYIYDDTTPESGLPLYYAVFTECEGVISTQGAILQAPVLLTLDISNEAVEVNDKHIGITWQTPPNTQGVVVVRKARVAPRSIDDGERLSLSSFTQLVDRDVQNGQTYYYRIYCQFKDQYGQSVLSAGKTIQATPETPPTAITQMEIVSTKTPQGYTVQLSWVVPAKGKVAILKSKERLPLSLGKTIPVSELKRYGDVLEGLSNTLTDIWRQPGMGYYTPVVIFNTMAYIGSPQRYACIDDVSNMRYENVGTALRLQWTWPERCQEVVVSYSYQGWPQLNNAADETTRRVTRAEYESLGYIDIRGVTDRDYYIIVAAVIKEGSEQITGSGARIQARLASKLILTYEIKQTGFVRKKRTLHLYARKPGLLPDLLLISRRDRLPLYKGEGEVLHHINGPLAIEKELSVELPEKTYPPRTFGKLYLKDDTLYEVVNIHHPSEDKLRLG